MDVQYKIAWTNYSVNVSSNKYKLKYYVIATYRIPKSHPHRYSRGLYI